MILPSLRCPPLFHFLVAVEKRSLTAAQYGDLAEVPAELDLEWLANITNPKTRRA
jgi:hypothetical protein